ncbi:hypothetical protein, partial [Cribrihabitans pelagius]|uniref:hypothetical protein n=1 Tax=Cribrihabitans pelagius TaxID=1765746 RepID=UPI003B5C4CEC
SAIACRVTVRGAAVTNLSHRASFHSREWIAPSNPGIKHLERISRKRNRLQRALNAQKGEIANLAGRHLQLIRRCSEEQVSASEARAARAAEEKRQEEAEEKARLAAAEAEVITASIESGLELVADGALYWQEAAPGQPPRLAWGHRRPRRRASGTKR